MKKNQVARNNQIRLTLVGISLLIIIVVAVYFNYFRGFDAVYFQLFYVVIIMVGLWFKRYVIQLAISLGIFNLILVYLSTGAFTIASFLRAGILLFAAFGIYFFIKQLEATHRNLERIMNSVGDGIIVVDMEMKVTMLNEVAEKMTGWTSDEALGESFKTVFNLSHENPEHEILNPVEEVFRTDRSCVLSNHAIITDRKGEMYNIEDSATLVKNSDGVTTGVVSVFRDITDRKAQAAKIEYLSYHDHLTGLHNRQYFEEALKQMDDIRYYPLSIIMGDVNSLKIINDSFGHLVGDGLIYETAKILKRCCRPTDVATRWGGDEFVLLLPNTDEETAQKTVARMNQAAVLTEVDQGILSISFGCDTKNDLSEDVMAVFKSAENRMYKNKLLMRPQVREKTMNAIIASLYENNSSEKRHAENVSYYGRQLAEAMGLSKKEIAMVGMVAQLHDIGKVVIDLKVLEKNEELSSDEWEVIMRHPEIGYHITNTSADMAEISLAILGHHERWDGTGYPKGLAGTAIPVLSRIIAIAGSYDTILSERTYKKSQNKSTAAREIMRCAGTQFDPELAELFVNQVVNNKEVVSGQSVLSPDTVVGPDRLDGLGVVYLDKTPLRN